MAKTLTGITWAYNAISQDYCLEESVNSLKEFCDEVIVLDAGSTDGTDELIKSLQDRKTKAILCSNEEWKEQQGKWKLSFFTNRAIEQATSDYIYSQQADEVTHEASYESIRRAIFNNYDGYLISRVNLWGTPYKMLNVPQERKPCSDVILRLAKKAARAYDDAESVMINGSVTDLFVNDIRMYHMGFVRKREVHPQKIRHIQAEVFQVGVDPKLEGMDVFDPYKWFDKSDLVDIREPLPALIQQWAKERE